MNPFIQYVKESIVDIPKANLDPTVFDFPDQGEAPFLKPIIKKQIMEDVDKFADIMGIKQFYIIGSILTKQYTERTDIDVTIEGYKEEVDDLLQGKILILIRLLNGRLATGTTHPINYYVRLDEIDSHSFDAMYDVSNDKWLKVPQNIQQNVMEYLNNFHKTVSTIDLTIAKLKRDIIDYETLSKFSQEDIKNLKTLLHRKLKEITNKIETLSGIRHAIIKKRKKAFMRPMTPEQIEKYKSKNYLPENIIYKMLERYYYSEFIKKLEKILGDKPTLDPKDIKSIKVVHKNACLKNFESFVAEGGKSLVMEKVKKIKLRKIDWKDPKTHSKSFMHKMFRSTGRKHLMQVPVSQRVNMSAPQATGIGSADKIITVAKKAPSGIWRITPSQVQWLAAKFHHIPPNAKKNLKHLGNTGIIVWRKAPNVYYLVKQSKHLITT